MKKRLAAIGLAAVLAMGSMGCAKKSGLLKDVYGDWFPIGAALAGYSIGLFEDDLLAHYGSITAENDMKWSELHPGPGVYDFAAADRLVEFAKERGMVMRGHTLVWSAALPAWVMRDNPSKEVLLERMREHIDAVVKHFGDDVYCWDVVNEVLHAVVTAEQLEKGDIYRTGSDAIYGGVASGDWYAVCGRDFIAEAFKAARKAADEAGVPGMKLFYNDVGLIDPYKRQAAVAMLEWLKSAGAPVDGVGLQCHYDIATFDVDQFEETVKTFTDMGLDVQITEADVSVYPWSYSGQTYTQLTKEVERAQAAVYGAMFEVCRRYAQPTDSGKGKVTGVTFWTIADDATWLDNDPVPGRKNWPGVFDTEHKPKQAYDAIVNF